METVTAFAQRQEASVVARSRPRRSSARRTLAVTATYLLSEEGRKASLLAGGDGRAVQEIAVEVPTNRLHLVSVDANGVARLKLRPRYQLDGEQRVVRIDSAPTYDAPPEVDDLFREAARRIISLNARIRRNAAQPKASAAKPTRSDERQSRRSS